MTRITIPSKLDDRLGQDTLSHAVRLYVKQFEGWVGDDTKGLFFFPEYTDHGPKHVSSVLAAAEALIREESWPLLTTEDAAVLVLATLLHDSAMHLTADGLLDLLNSERAAKRPLIGLLDSKTWPALFDDFFAEARRWDQRKLHRILGDQNKPAEGEEDLVDTIRRPSELANPEKWTIRYRKFLGEFVRRHHARLAHEIVHQGVPGNNSGTLKPLADLDRIADLAGLVARSHNISLRGTFDYLEQKYWGRATCRSSHPVFLMVLLRIADYLEIQADRVNPTLLEIQRLRSPLSQEEQASHASVEEVRPHEQDEEAILVLARPRSAASFLKLQRLLQGLQAELDTSWAVLGEIFSRDNKLRGLGLKLRRVRSNLDNPADFLEREQPPYLPIKAAFDTAGADLLKLLIVPLYGNEPEVGIRELLQNSLDAVHELRQWAADHGDPEMKTIRRTEQEADVTICIDTDEAGQPWLTVSDKGIGMRAETIRDYFLKAGASFRQSDAWRQQFEDKGVSKVLRSGRFGIGALAGFLLGTHIQVLTRHAEEPEDRGIQFNAALSDEQIELLTVSKTTVGTLIKIQIAQPAANGLTAASTEHTRWDWFSLADPTVKRFLHGQELSQTHHTPSRAGELLPSDWREIKSPGFEHIYWTYSQAPSLTCNGIRIGPDDDKQWIDFNNEANLSPPNVSVIDPNGRLSLNLQRDSLDQEPPFSEDVQADVAADMLAFFLLHSPTRRDFTKEAWRRIAYFKENTHGMIDLLWTAREGLLIALPWHIKRSHVNRIIFEAETKIKLRDMDINSAICTVPVNIGGHIKYLASTAFGIPVDSSTRNTSNELLFDPGTVRVERNPSTRLFDRLIDDPIIPFDRDQRRVKFARAFSELKAYIDTWERSDLVGWRRDLLERIGAEGYQKRRKSRSVARSSSKSSTS